MFFFLISIFVPLILYAFLPWTVQVLTQKQPKRDRILLSACILFFVSWYLPSPLIHEQHTAFTTHFIGGGVFTGLFWLFLKRHMRWNTSWFIELLSLYALVSALGVTNEIFELTTAEFGLTRLTGTDTWWDLLANTLGALSFWIIYRVIARARHDRDRQGPLS